MQEEHKNKIEAILFTTGKFMTVEEISKLCGIASPGIIKQALTELKKDYEARNSALQIFEANQKWKLNIKKGYTYLTQKLLSDTEFDKPTQETLAIIAYKQPAVQAEVVKIRGNKAYDHVRNLREAEFITSEKFGRTRLLKLTPKFYDYFDTIEPELKTKFEEVEKKVQPELSEDKKEEGEEVEKRA